MPTYGLEPGGEAERSAGKKDLQADFSADLNSGWNGGPVRPREMRQAKDSLKISDAVRGQEDALHPIFERNKGFVKMVPTGSLKEPNKLAMPESYQTFLSKQEEPAFQEWVLNNKVPFDLAQTNPDYDMRGYWKALQAGDPRAKTKFNAQAGAMHFPDTWKTPYHETFSGESIYADPATAPMWRNNRQLVGKDGKVLYDESVAAAKRVKSKSDGNRDAAKKMRAKEE